MQIKLSRTLTTLLEDNRQRLADSGKGYGIVDRLFLSILETDSHAKNMLSKMLREWELKNVKDNVEKQLVKNKKDLTRDIPSEQEYIEYVGMGIAVACGSIAPQPALANTGHLLLAIVNDKTLFSARVLETYGVTVGKVAELVREYPVEEDYYDELQALRMLQQQSVENEAEEEFGDHDSDSHNDADGAVLSGGSATRVEKKAVKSIRNLEKYGTNLTRAAAAGEIDPVIGRDGEIERLVQILSRRKKNNPVLIGEAGVGKSAIVEGLAQRIASGEVPSTLRNKIVFSLDVSSLVAGTKYRGQFEERMKAIVDQLQQNPAVILFIDEIHTIVGAGSSQGSLDAANILKPALARGQMQCIGATTLNEYRENIEKDAALERRFQKIIVEPTTAEQTLQILHNIKHSYEQHHMVRYTDEALKACVDMTGRYITDRNFPDKAIDALDEAGAKVNAFNIKEPDFLVKMESELARKTHAKREAVAKQDFESAANIRLQELAVRDRLEEQRMQWVSEQANDPYEVGAEIIAQVINSMTGIPVDKVTKDEKTKLLGMAESLRGKIVGQDMAVEKITNSIQRSRAGLKDPNKPIGVFMFVGPTGVGKTHLAKELSQWMFDSRDSMVRIDMSEYSEKHNVSRLIGSPPGYVGYGEGGQLTEAVRRQPYSVVLFDEVEKAHPDVFNVMLQVFDEGQLTDGLGRKVDFRNTIIIMTSNVGSRAVAQKPNAVGFGTKSKDSAQTVAREGEYRRSLEAVFAPEFINRIDDIVIFNTLTSNDMATIVDIELSQLVKRVEGLGYKVQVAPSARKMLASEGYEPHYGVRALKRVIMERVEQPIAQLIVGGKIAEGGVVKVVKKGTGIEVRPRM